MTERKKVIRISVRRLVEFLLRSGSIESGGTGLSREAAMLEGARIHRRLQKQAGESYHAEVPLRLDIPIPFNALPPELPAEPVSAAAENEILRFLREDGNVLIDRKEQEKAFPHLEDREEQEKTFPRPEDRKEQEKRGEDLPRLEEQTEQDKVFLRLEGRADGIIFDSGVRVIDEIKTVPGSLGNLEAPREVHLAQARCYAYIHARGEGLLRVRIRMTYCSQATEEVRFFYEELQFEELEAWFGGLIRAYLPWIGLQLYFEKKRMETIRQAVFPFPYREGQHALAAGVYRTIVHGKKLFLQAPTGTGKTMAVLFPALKAIGEDKAERIFYLTAKAVTGHAALDALQILSERGLRVRSLVLASKERICPERMDCRPAQCPRADGHFDRVNAALWVLLREAAGGAPMTSAFVEECARRHCVCPYELSMDAADFADIVICDYNYAFHPSAQLNRFFGEGAEKGTILLVDEAHNLLERGRSMYSADLSAAEVRRFRRSVRDVYPRLWKSMKGLTGVLRRLEKEAKGQEVRPVKEPAEFLIKDPAGEPAKNEGKAPAKEPAGGPAGPDRQSGGEILPPESRQDLLRAIGETMRVISWILEQENRSRGLYASDAGESADGSSALLEFYFSITRFHNILEELDSHYMVYAAPPGFVLHLFCADPSARLQACMKRSTAAVLFSATFLPIQYYKGLLGGTQEDYEMYARSSFSPAQQKVVLVRDVTSRYRARNGENYRRIAQSIGGIVSCRPGNYMVFFPSYAFLENVLEAFAGIFPDAYIHAGQGAGPAGDTAVPAGDPAVPAGDPAFPAAAAGVKAGPGSSSMLLSDTAVSGTLGEAPLREDAAGKPVSRMDLLVQRPKMDDAERAAFLKAFQETRADRYLVGFCVLGGMFGEGIDLQGDRLIGSFVVGTGIPPVEPHREMLKAYFYAQGVNGYDYAYRFPGMNKVLQAAGRVIRTSQDRGVILLLDERFTEASNRAMFPVEWGTLVSAASTEAAEIVRLFWQEDRRT